MVKIYSLLNSKKLLLLTAVVMIVWVTSCKREAETPEPKQLPTPYELPIPPGFPPPYLSSKNPLTEEGIALGKKLYSDPILSSNGLSCSSCHHREKSFSTPIFTSSTGEKQSVPPHVNLAFNPDYNWNGNTPELDLLCMADFEPEFFNTNKDSLYSRLSKHAEYPDMFNKAFNITDVRQLDYELLKNKICFAISQYMRTLISANARFDRYQKNQEKLTKTEFDGMVIFFTEKGDCFHCHGGRLFTDNLFHNNGISSTFDGLNKGRFLVSGNPADMGLFSSPTLRNIEYTAPYMHDGRFQTLEEVVEFYNSGVKHSATLDPIMTKAGKEFGLQLSTYEKQSLVAFLKTLSDEEFAGLK